MRSLLRLAASLAWLSPAAWAVYAPIPEQEQGKALSYRVAASVYHDSNIFGTAAGEVDSMVYNLSPAIMFNSSLDEQTFASASYEASIDRFSDRPGTKTVVSHSLSARLAHQFSPQTNIDLSDAYAIAKNPESLLPGIIAIQLSPDQSYRRNEFDARFTTVAGPKTSLVLKYRNVAFNYDADALSLALDRLEHLVGLEASYAFLPETKLVGEYRYQAINYDTGGSTKDKRSNFVLVGTDYTAGQKLMLSARAGLEDRSRSSANGTTAPYAELSARYSYAEGSFFSTGYSYSLEEVSDVVNYTDSKVNRFFVNVQHQVTGVVTASGSIDYEPSQLVGRAGHAGIDETTTRFGVAVSWLPTKNWAVTATYDVDHISSDSAVRNQHRNRAGMSVRFSF